MFAKNIVIQRLCQQSAKYFKIIHNLHNIRTIPTLKTKRQLCLSTSKFHNHDLASQKVPHLVRSVPVNKFSKRTHTCGELGIENVGENVELCGWLEFQRLGKFIILRDGYGSIQLIIGENQEDLSKIMKDLTFESVLRATGKVVERPAGQENKSMATGKIEVMVESLEVLSSAKAQLPFSLRKFNKAKEQLQMQYRYLAFRFPELQRNLRLRSEVISKMREYLTHQCAFVDIETPTLFRRTPGGAQEFVVPTRLEGKFYSLVQSPQQFKQLLMIGGFDRYFQIARCYRDEGSRNDRQPEFTQLDVEMSFTDRERILELIEELVVYCWPEDFSPMKIPFARFTYDHVMEKYGTDAPDLRIPYQLQNLSEIFGTELSQENETFGAYAVVFPGCSESLSKSVQNQLAGMSRMYFKKMKLLQMKVCSDSISSKLSKIVSENVAKRILEKLQLKEGDVLFLAYGDKTDAQRVTGRLRVEFTNILEANGHFIRTPGFEFLWVLDFPLFNSSKDGCLESMHHPFTQPHPEDVDFLFTEPTKVRGLHYDLVMNGAEIGGGSIRIHEQKLQTQILKMLKIEIDQLQHLLEALDCGAPPHGGIALGLDRFIALLCKSDSIREVIAFPKTMDGKDLMSGAPSTISDEEKRQYHLK